jgi:trypsin-like peptidase
VRHDTRSLLEALGIEKLRRSPAKAAAIAGACAVLAIAAWLALRPAPPQLTSRLRAQMETAIAVGVGRVHRIELSGASVPLGAAFAIAPGLLVTACEGLAPNAEIVVRYGARRAPVHVADVDPASQLCRLNGADVGSSPLEIATRAPVAGEPVYTTTVAPTGEARIVEGRLKAIAVGPTRELVVDGQPQLGAPLFDAEGRVAAVATRIGGRDLYVPVPAAWRKR